MKSLGFRPSRGWFAIFCKFVIVTPFVGQTFHNFVQFFESDPLDLPIKGYDESNRLEYVMV